MADRVDNREDDHSATAPDVAVAVFVVSSDDKHGAPLPGFLEKAQVCNAAPCNLIAAPKLLGRSGFPMTIEVGNQTVDQMFRAEIHARHAGPELDVGFKGTLWGEDAEPQRMKFEGSVSQGQLVHLGTLNGRTKPGPDVYAVFVQGEPNAMRAALRPWSNSG